MKLLRPERRGRNPLTSTDSYAVARSVLILAWVLAAAPLAGQVTSIAVIKRTVAALPAVTSGHVSIAFVTDGASGLDCEAGLGTVGVLCVNDGTGSGWRASAAAGGASFGIVATPTEVLIATASGETVTLLATAPLAISGDDSAKTITWTVALGTTLAPGVLQLATLGEATAGEAMQSNDPRGSDARAPTSHGSTHGPAGGDPLPAGDYALSITGNAITATTAGAGDTATGFFPAGTVEAARLPALSALSGSVTDSQVPDSITVNAAGVASAAASTPGLCTAGLYARGVLTNWDAANCTADDDVPEDADLGSGTANSSTYLRGDRTWAAVPAGGVTGPSPSTVRHVSLWSDTSGTALLDSLVAIDTSGGISTPFEGSATSPALRLGPHGGGVFYESGIGIALVAGTDGYVRIWGHEGGGSYYPHWYWHPNTHNLLAGGGSGHAEVYAESSSATQPSYMFSNDQSGLGNAATGDIRLIANSQSVIGVTTSSGQGLAETYGASRDTPQASPPFACDGSHAGWRYYDTSNAGCLCDGTAWQNEIPLSGGSCS